LWVFSNGTVLSWSFVCGDILDDNFDIVVIHLFRLFLLDSIFASCIFLGTVHDTPSGPSIPETTVTMHPLSLLS
jgi:hypothetical protein